MFCIHSSVWYFQTLDFLEKCVPNKFLISRCCTLACQSHFYDAILYLAMMLYFVLWNNIVSFDCILFNMTLYWVLWNIFACYKLILHLIVGILQYDFTCVILNNIASYNFRSFNMILYGTLYKQNFVITKYSLKLKIHTKLMAFIHYQAFEFR